MSDLLDRLDGASLAADIAHPGADAGTVAAAIIAAGTDTLEALVAVHLDAPITDAFCAAHWLQLVADEYLVIDDRLTVDQPAVDGFVARIPSPSRPGMTALLDVDRPGPAAGESTQLSALRALAGDMAAAGILDTLAVAPAGLGRFAGLTIDRRVVLISRLIVDDHAEHARVLAHELAHVLDPNLDATPATRERFADALGELMLEHEPTTVDGVTPLLDWATNIARRPTRWAAVGLPDIDRAALPATLVRFASLFRQPRDAGVF